MRSRPSVGLGPCLLVLLVAVWGCTPSVSRPPVAPAPDDRPAKLAAAEQQVLAALGVVDGRLERRFGIHATDKDLHHAATQLIVAEDPDGGLIEGRIHVFSFSPPEPPLS